MKKKPPPQQYGLSLGSSDPEPEQKPKPEPSAALAARYAALGPIGSQQYGPHLEKLARQKGRR